VYYSFITLCYCCGTTHGTSRRVALQAALCCFISSVAAVFCHLEDTRALESLRSTVSRRACIDESTARSTTTPGGVQHWWIGTECGRMRSCHRHRKMRQLCHCTRKRADENAATTSALIYCHWLGRYSCQSSDHSKRRPLCHMRCGLRAWWTREQQAGFRGGRGCVDQFFCLRYADDTQSDIGVESRLRKSTSKIGIDIWCQLFIPNPLGMKNRRRKQTWQSAT